MQCKIPEDMRAQLADDPFMQRCILERSDCSGRIEWNHAFSYAGKRQNELWALLPMCEFHHRTQAAYRLYIDAVLRMRVYYFNAVDDFKEKYSKSTLI